MAEKHASPQKIGLGAILLALVIILVAMNVYNDGTDLVFSALSVITGAVTGLALFVLLMMRAGKAYDPEILRAHNLASFELEAGHLDEAARQLEALLEDGKTRGVIQATATLNLGYCYLRQGVVEAALRNYQRVVDEHPQREQQFQFYGELPVHLACRFAEAYALTNHAPQAHNWLENARSGKTPVRPGALIVPEMILLLKKDAWREAAELAERHWYEIEAATRGHGCRAARVLRAFALSKLPADEGHAPLIKQLLQGARPHRMAEYDYLAYQWPPLDTFLVEQGFKAPPMIPKPEDRAPQA